KSAGVADGGAFREGRRIDALCHVEAGYIECQGRRDGGGRWDSRAAAAGGAGLDGRGRWRASGASRDRRSVSRSGSREGASRGRVALPSVECERRRDDDDHHTSLAASSAICQAPQVIFESENFSTGALKFE